MGRLFMRADMFDEKRFFWYSSGICLRNFFKNALRISRAGIALLLYRGMAIPITARIACGVGMSTSIPVIGCRDVASLWNPFQHSSSMVSGRYSIAVSLVDTKKRIASQRTMI